MHFLNSWTRILFPSSRRSGIREYVIASTLVIAALGLRLAIAPANAGMQYVTFFPAVTLAALLCGFWPGIFACNASIVLANYLFAPPHLSLSFAAFENGLWAALIFFANGLLVCLSIETMSQYRLTKGLELENSKRAKAVLKASMQHMREILDNLFAYVALLDLDGRIIEMNRAPLVRGGHAKEAVIGQYFFDTPWWSHDDQVRAQLIDAIAAARAGEVRRYDVLVRMGDDLVPIDFQISPVRDADGRIIRLLPTAVDIADRKKTENELAKAKLLMDSIVDNIPTMVFLKRASDLHFELMNKAGEQLLGYSASEIIGKNDYDFFQKEEADFFRAEDRKVFADGGIKIIPEEAITTASGEIRYLTTRKVALIDANGQPAHLLGVAVDITEQKKAEEALRIAAATFESNEDILVTDNRGIILRVNKAFERTTGYSADEVVGKTPRILSSGRHGPEFYADMWERIRMDGAWEGEIWDRRKNGDVYPKWLRITALKNAQGETTEYVGLASDITERKQAEEEIRNLAFYDPLTRLPNRRLLFDRCELAISAAARSKRYGAMLFLDIDQFKVLNDTLGHNFGDKFLIEVAKRISSSVREVDTVARIGGDEFVVLVEDLNEDIKLASQKAAQVAETIRASLVFPYQIAAVQHHSSASIGICVFNGKERSLDELLQRADIALYQAKKSGRDTVRFYEPHLQKAIEARAAIEAELRKAVLERQFQLYYQLQYDGESRSVGAEALIRWIHPTRGMVSPAEFIPIAEECSLILDIGQWVIEEACRQLALWDRNERTRHLHLAVNVSAHQFMAPDFVGAVAAALKAFDIGPSRLMLELTESVVLHDVGVVANKMRELKTLGVMLSLDDFGTGYSSLAYLKSLWIDQIKIDQSFVRDIPSDSNDSIMVKAIVDLAKNFGLDVIAEGVETKEQLSFLKGVGCKAYQGYYFAKPLPVQNMEAMLS